MSQPELFSQFLRSIHSLDASQHSKMATELFLHQLKNNHPYRRHCKSLGVTPESINTWQDIPAVTTDVFKMPDCVPSCLSESDRNITFRTSGTTGEVRGEHHFRDTSIYEQSILTGWKSCGVPELHETTFLLTPNPEWAPDSSLGHMMETLKRAWCPTAQYLLNADGDIDLQPLLDAAEMGKPVTLLGTALAFLHLFERLPENLKLAPNSWAMETGGYKGTGRSLTKEVLYDMFAEHLDLSADNIWNEYSMTELSSQFYTRGLGRPHTGPEWTRIKVIDPETGRQVAKGEMGYLVIYDLANVDSVMAIRTQDLAIYHDERHFTLIGRDPSALPRGCSRSADAALS